MSDQTRKPGARGPKPGSPATGGIPKGYKFPRTILKEEAKAQLQEMVLSRLRPIVEAGIHSAMGISHFMLRDPATGMFQRLTDPKEIDAALAHPDAQEGSSYLIYTKDPDTNARKDILDRALGKPKEEHDVTLTVNEPLSERLKKTKARLGI